MKLQAYQPLAMRTCNALNDSQERRLCRFPDLLAHGAFGLAGEVGEIIQAEVNHDSTNMAEEIGDAMWYLAILAEGYGTTLHECYDPHVILPSLPLDSLTIGMSMCVDQVKRYIYYSTPEKVCAINQDKFTTGINLCLNALEELASEYTPFDFEECLDRNIEKLKIRYPEKFSTEAATQRDVKKEAEAFEK